MSYISYPPTLLYHKIQFSVHSVTKDSPQSTRDFSKNSQKKKRSFIYKIFFWIDNKKYTFFPFQMRHPVVFNLLKPSGFYTYQQVYHPNILHGARFALSALYGSQNRQRVLLYTSLTDWFL
jgi:hypothetical protein